MMDEKEVPVEITNKNLLNMFQALQELGTRFLPSLNSDVKVGRMTSFFEPSCSPIGPAKKKLLADFGEQNNLEELTETALSILVAKLEVEMNAYDAVTVKVMLPRERITREDLPKERTGDDGWKNGTGLGALIANLGPLFQDADDLKT
jgi:hypothetical protein